ncbi:MAG TPA: hypothetical protein VMP67_03810 [Candidatus Limnocylindria bacterium]|nr:hypothetical protein [Candidatus Limnocylindria bacterium]
MERLSVDLDFTLHSSDAEVEMRLRRFGERWVAQARHGTAPSGVGLTPRSALSAALEPFGARARVEFLADLCLLEPSVELAAPARLDSGGR